jgi:hypothetical protein
MSDVRHFAPATAATLRFGDVMATSSVSPLVRPLSLSGLLAAVWIVAAAVRPALTFHLAPALIAGSVPLLVSVDEPANRRRVALNARTGFGVAVTVGGVSAAG